MKATTKDIFQAIERGDHEALERLLAVEPGTDPNILPVDAQEGWRAVFYRCFLCCSEKDQVECARVLVDAAKKRTINNFFNSNSEFSNCAINAKSNAMLDVLEEYFFSNEKIELTEIFPDFCCRCITELSIKRYAPQVQNQPVLTLGLKFMMENNARFEYLIIPHIDVESLDHGDHQKLLLQSSQLPIEVVFDALYRTDIAIKIIDLVRNNPDRFQGISTKLLEMMVEKNQIKEALSLSMDQARETKGRVI